MTWSEIINMLNAYSALLTFIVTTIYAVITVFILRANKRSADASFSQIEESKRQFEETQRLEIMPYLQFESVGGLPTTSNELKLSLVNGNSPQKKSKDEDFLLQVKNIGHGTATAIKCAWENCSKHYPFPITALQNGDAQSFRAWGLFPNEIFTEDKKAILRLFYCDLLRNQYEQKIELTFTYDHLNLRVQLTLIDAQSPQFIKESSNV